MNKKTYVILMLTTLVIGVLLLVFLPPEQMLYVFFLPIVMWIVYAILIRIEKAKEKKNSR